MLNKTGKRGRPKGSKNKPKGVISDIPVQELSKEPSKKLSTESKIKPVKKATENTENTENTKRSTVKKTKKVVSCSKPKKKVVSKNARKTTRKKTCKPKKNEFKEALEEVKGKRKKKRHLHKKLDNRNKKIDWVTVDEDGNEVEVTIEEGVVTNTKIGKVLGYCPECGVMIGTYDLESKFIFICEACDYRARTKELRKDSKGKREYSSKKEYFESTINANHLDMPAHLTQVPDFHKDV